MAIPFTSQLIFGISMAIYLVSFLGYLIFTASQSRRYGTGSTILLSVGFALHSIGLVLRWMETRPGEWRETVEKIQSCDCLIVGRTQAAYATHPQR